MRQFFNTILTILLGFLGVGCSHTIISGGWNDGAGTVIAMYGVPPTVYQAPSSQSSPSTSPATSSATSSSVSSSPSSSPAPSSTTPSSLPSDSSSSSLPSED